MRADSPVLTFSSRVEVRPKPSRIPAGHRPIEGWTRLIQSPRFFHGRGRPLKAFRLPSDLHRHRRRPHRDRVSWRTPPGIRRLREGGHAATTLRQRPRPSSASLPRAWLPSASPESVPRPDTEDRPVCPTTTLSRLHRPTRTSGSISGTSSGAPPLRPPDGSAGAPPLVSRQSRAAPLKDPVCWGGVRTGAPPVFTASPRRFRRSSGAARRIPLPHLCPLPPPRTASPVPHSRSSSCFDPLFP